MLEVEDIARDYVHCTQCGACELRCPNTLFTGDFYRFRTRTVDLVKAVRALAVDAGVHQPGWQEWNRLTDDRRHEPVRNGTPVDQARVADWADGLGLPVGGETVLFCDCEAAFHRTSLPRALARILQAAGVEFGLMREQWCCGGPGGRDGLRRAGPALRRAQPRRLAGDRRQADHRRSTPTTTSRSPRTTRASSATTSTSSSCWRWSWWPSWCARAGWR